MKDNIFTRVQKSNTEGWLFIAILLLLIIISKTIYGTGRVLARLQLSMKLGISKMRRSRMQSDHPQRPVEF
jgi:hypothetical protein